MALTTNFLQVCFKTKLPYLTSTSELHYISFPRTNFSAPVTIRNKRSAARCQPQQSEAVSAANAFSNLKHILLPITDKNPYLSDGTKQAAATATSLAKNYGAQITVVVIDDKPKESNPELEKLFSTIRWHLSEGGFQEFQLLEKLGSESHPTAIIGEVADDLNLDLVVVSMEAIHSKHIDANLLVEFIPCPVLLLPL